MYMNTANGIVGYGSGGQAVVGGGGGGGGLSSSQSDGNTDLNSYRPKPVFFWSNGEVMKWMKRHCEEYYELYGNVFLENEITGRSLIRINEFALERMGIDNAEHRDQIARIILKLRLKSDIIELKDLERKAAPISSTSTTTSTSASTSTGTTTVKATNSSTSSGTSITRSGGSGVGGGQTSAPGKSHLLSSFHR